MKDNSKNERIDTIRMKDIVSQMEQVQPPKPVAKMPKAPQTETTKAAPAIEKEIQKFYGRGRR